MRKYMSRQQKRQFQRIAEKKGEHSKEVIAGITNTIQDKIIQAVTEVDKVALMYVLNECTSYSQEEKDHIYQEFEKTVEKFNAGELDYASLKSEYMEEEQ